MELVQQLRHLPTFAVEIARISIWLLLLMAVFVPLEKLFSLHKQEILRKSFLLDLGYYFINSLLPKMILVIPMGLIAWLLHRVVPGGVQTFAQGMPIQFRLLGALVVGEVGFYWGHRWSHEIPFLWRFHAVHHSAEEMDWLVNTKVHPFDVVFMRLCGFVPMYALGLAQPMAGRSIDMVPLLVMLVGTIWGFFIHSNVRWQFGWLAFVIATPMFHHWHHTRNEHIDKNYASMLPWMDKVFGTWYLPKKVWPPQYGTDTVIPEGLAGQLLYPLAPTHQEHHEEPVTGSAVQQAS
jgi:sterol desaturase/sphingolipid hydroxylase (fatty acid hydroxylase superfamily)